MTAITPLPRHLPLPDAIHQQRKVSGVVPSDQLARLNSALEAPCENLFAVLQCGPQPRALGRVQGHVQGTVRLCCQRCLEPFDHVLVADADWTLVDNPEDEERLLDTCDPIVITDARLGLWAAVEDEAILSLPIAPHCSAPQCVAQYEATDANEAELGHTSGLSSPGSQAFAALKAQWKGKN